jgi:methylene-tetrahydromethanopterin dehydrogenase
MERPYVLHMFTPGKQMSPFDVNMAADAGWQIIVPYAEVGADTIGAMTQDTIFSRGPKGALRSGIFIGGRDVMLAQDMADKARAAMFKPFVVSLMADPSGAFTTAAAMVASVDAALLHAHGAGLAQRRVLIVGGTGPVGRIAGVMAAQLGALVTLAGRSATSSQQAARETGERFGVVLQSGAAGDRALIESADVVLACAAAGVQVLGAEDLAAATQLKVAADVNAVPPAGIAGLGVMDDAKPLAGSSALGIGALAIGNIKYQTQQRLLVQMRGAEKAVTLGVAEALAMARSVLAEPTAA